MFSKIAALLLIAPLAVNGLSCYSWNFQDGQMPGDSTSTELGYYACSGPACVKHSFKRQSKCAGAATTTCIAYGYQWRGATYYNGDYSWQTFSYGGCNEQTIVQSYWTQYGAVQQASVQAVSTTACAQLVKSANDNGAAYSYTVHNNKCEICGPGCSTTGACPDSFNSQGTASSGEGDYCNSERIGAAASHGPSALVVMAIAAAARFVWQQ